MTPIIKGMPAKIIAGNSLGGNYLVCMPEGVSKISDLKGKIVAVPGQMGSLATLLRLALKEAGLDPEKDVNIVAIERSLQVIALTEKKNVDCIVASEPLVSKAIKSKAYIAIDNKNLFENQFPEMWVIARIDIIQNNPEDLKKLLKEHMKSIKMLNENEEEAATILADYYSANDLNITLEEVLKQIKTYDYDYKINKTMIENALKTLYEQGIIEKTMPVDELMDCSFGYCG